MHHPHPYAVQTAAMYLSSIPALGVLGLVIGARVEQARRGTPAQTPARPVLRPRAAPAAD